MDLVSLTLEQLAASTADDWGRMRLITFAPLVEPDGITVTPPLVASEFTIVREGSMVDEGVLFVGTDEVVRITGLRDESGATVDDAELVADVYQVLDGTKLTSDPLTFAAAGHGGVYTAILPASLQLVADHEYDLRVTATRGGQQFTFVCRRVATFAEI